MLGIACAGLLAACGSAGGAAGGPAGGSAGDPGPVDVLYAGSLVTMMQNQLGPGFQRATGYTVTGFPGGSKELATEIRGKVREADVFISASPGVNASLEGAANGGWVSWYATYATSALVLGYNPDSKFAADLKTKPWYQAITEPGLRLGFTDPATDPKGQLTVEALNAAAASRDLPALKTLASDQGDVFPEETLVGRLQAGQLDAGFFYASEAVAARIPAVPLAGVDLKASYTVTVVSGAPHATGADAFVSYLLGPRGQAILKQDGFALVSPPKVVGSGVPASLRGVLRQP